MTERLKFKLLELAEQPNGLTEAVVELDRDTADFAHLICTVVLVDDKPFLVTAPHRKAHAPPWRQGEIIGLVGGFFDAISAPTTPPNPLK